MFKQEALKTSRNVAGKLSNIEHYAPWLVLATFLALTYLLWLSAHNASIQEQRIEFDFQVRDTSERIQRSLAHYEQVLYGSASVLP